MKCKNCGKKLKKGEIFCNVCGYYNGDVNNTDWDEQVDLLQTENDSEKIEDFSNEVTDDDKFNYEEETLLEAYIGEDYKMIKKWPFNIWAFLLNWMYFLYRKLYITGIIGLFVSWIMVLILKEKVLIPFGIMLLIIGIFFNKYYLLIAKRRIEKIKEEMEGTDRFSLANICKERGGVRAGIALLIYAIFLVLVFFSIYTIHITGNNKSKFWKENSTNKANCNSLIKQAYSHIEKEQKVGKVQDATCEIRVSTRKEYEIYIKTNLNNKTYYSYYATTKGELFYKNNTLELENLLLKKSTLSLTKEESKQLLEKQNIENYYQEIYRKSQEEDELIERKENTEEKKNYYFNQQEIIR